jgi:hypothetical protein
MKVLIRNITMIILNKFRDVKSYVEGILKYKYNLEPLKMECPACGGLLTYFGCYEVNYIDDEDDRKIPILRGLCSTCKKTHSVKPFFLPGKHQYALKCRETAVKAYQQAGLGLKKSLKASFNNKEISVMNLKYWLKTTATKCSILTNRILQNIQQYFSNVDIVSDYIREHKSIDSVDTIYNLSIKYIKLFTGTEPEDSFFSRFNIVNAVSNEECTGLYL